MIVNLLQNNEVQAISKYIRISPNKVRRVLKQIKGKKYKDALRLLKFMPYASCKPIFKVLRSAASNVQNNKNFNETSLFVKSAFVDQGPVLKRFRQRARGKAYPILKAVSHITIVMSW